MTECFVASEVFNNVNDRTKRTGNIFRTIEIFRFRSDGLTIARRYNPDYSTDFLIEFSSAGIGVSERKTGSIKINGWRN